MNTSVLKILPILFLKWLYYTSLNTFVSYLTLQTLPEEFVKRYGAFLPYRIGLSCKNLLWVVKYDLQKMEIYGLNKFMRHYGLKIFNMAQLDYYGDGLFIVTLFKDTTLEFNYPTGSPNRLHISTEWQEENRDDYVVSTGTSQFENCVTSILFNGCSNKDGYASMLIMESDMEMEGGIMVF